MAGRDKRIERIRRRPAAADFMDVRAVLELYGWEYASTKGSHARFRKAGERSIILPIHGGKVGRFYLDDICNRLGLDDEAGID